MRPFALLLAFASLLPSCSRLDPAPPPPSAPSATAAPASAAVSLGTVMSEVGRRFELAGRAAAASRFELAEFEAGEIGELFTNDIPRAELPKEGPTAHIQGMAKAFLDANAPDLQKAAASHDFRTFATAFERTATACNTCHKTSAKPFIEVPTVPGKSVPNLEPLPAASAPKTKP